MNKKKVCYIFVCLLLSVAMLVGCSTTPPISDSPSQSQEGGGNEGDTLSIACTFSNLTNPLYASISETMQNLAAEKGYEIVVLGCEDEPATQVSQIENFIESGVDVIVLGVVARDSVTEVCARAQEAGIKIVAYGVGVENYDTELIVENYEGGYLAAQAAKDYVDNNLGGDTDIKIGLMDIGDGLKEGVDRRNGLIDGLAEFFPDVEYLGPQECFTVEVGMDIADTYLQAEPDLDLIITLGDGGAIGASEAAKAAGKTNENFAVVGFDATQESLQKIVDEDMMVATIACGGSTWLGEKLFELAELAAEGTAEEHYDIPVEIITKENAEEFAEEQNFELA